jgi:hypothetical protein
MKVSTCGVCSGCCVACYLLIKMHGRTTIKSSYTKFHENLLLVSQRRTQGWTDIRINIFLARKQRLKSVSVGETQLVLVRCPFLRWSSQATAYDSVMMPTLAIKLVGKLRTFASRA